MAGGADLRPGNVVSRFLYVSVGSDSSLIDLKLMLANGPMTLRFATETLEEVTVKLNEIAAYLKTRTATQTDHIALRASEVVDVTVEARAESGKLILLMRGSNNVAHQFAIPVEVADRFRSELERAIQSANQ